MRWPKHRIWIFEIEPINQTLHCLLIKVIHASNVLRYLKAVPATRQIYFTRAGCLSLMLQDVVS